ncbi:MAG: SGNH/GDSL hydrolase family protein [Clostridia bacterium]|nr:SGNH/GDSL hydrolase family protein [Clostridia bacterium]
MDITKFYAGENEKPLDNIVSDGGFCSIFRTIGCVGDSLSSGEFESLNENNERGYHDMYEYSWGQFMARMMGSEVYNFSRGGMRADTYCKTFADEKDFWNPDKKCQCYILALGVNDITHIDEYEGGLGEASDIDVNDWHNNKKSFAGYYGQIIQRYREIQPRARFFLMTIPKKQPVDEKRVALEDAHQKLLHEIAELFDHTYVLDLREYAPLYDAEFYRHFFMGHMNPMGYVLTAKMVASYIDFIIRKYPEDFNQVGFIGTDLYNKDFKD